MKQITDNSIRIGGNQDGVERKRREKWSKMSIMGKCG